MENNERTDTERLDWLEKQDGYGVISDDNGRWAVPDSGTQNLADAEGHYACDTPIDISCEFFVPAEAWRPSIREAVDAAMEKEAKERSG